MIGQQLRTWLLAAMAAAAVAGPAAPAAAQEIALRGTVLVQGQFIRLGDLFDNAGKHAEKRIAYAPTPGHRTVLDAAWLYNVARTNGLDWKPLNLNTRSIVERESQVILEDEIESAILAELRRRDLDGPAELQFTSRTPKLHVPVDAPPTLEIQGLNYDPQSGRFIATVAAPAGDPNAQRLKVSGRANQLVDVPVPARVIRSGDVIREGDLEIVQMPARRVRADTLVHMDEIVGQAARRTLRPGVALFPASIQTPLLVERRSLVTVVLSVPNMHLTAQAKALQQGSLGDVIEVENLQSGIVVDAEIIGADRVRVLPAQHLAQN